jgi:hypothetical protein
MPPISISRAATRAEHNGHVQALFTPNTEGSLLRDGRDCIVMQVLNAPVDLLITAYLETSGAAVPALKVDKIRLEGDSFATPAAADIPAQGISIVGHIERVGDIVAKPGQQLGDPAENLRLEGFDLRWPDKPDGLDLTYAAYIEGIGATSPVGLGQYCGTRNAAKRIVGVTFTLLGPKAEAYQLKGKAVFSGGYEVRLKSGEPLSGPTGLEHLTSLEVDVVKKRAGQWEPSEKTKVFRPTKLPVKPTPRKT